MPMRTKPATAQPAADSSAAEPAEDSTAVAPAADEYHSLWHNRDFVRFWFGETLSLLGTQVTNLALPLTAIYAFGATEDQVGVLRFLQLVPYIGLALLFGVWVDRVSRRAVMLGSNLVRMVLVGLVPLLYELHVLNMGLLMVIACVLGIASVLFDVSWMPFVPVLVKHPKYYVEANSKMGISTSATDVAGPGFAGLLVAAVGAPIALVVDAVSYLISAVTLLQIHPEEPRRSPAADRRVLTELRDGLRWVFGNSILRWLAFIGFCCNFSMITVWTMFLLYGTKDLHLGSSAIGGIFAMASIGGLIGAMLSRRVLARFPLGRVYLIAQSGLLLGPIFIVLASGPRVAMIAIFVLSFFTTYLGLGIAGVIVVSVRQTTTPVSMMGRMTACFRMLLFGGGALGGLNAGLLSGAVGARHAIAIAATASALVVIGLILSPVSRLRELPPAAVEPFEESLGAVANAPS
jgi:MFS family permease